MLRAYFSVAENTSARLVRMRWFPSRPTLQFAFAGVTLIQMGQPMFESGLDRRAICVSVDGGVLLMPSSRARLMIELIRRPGGVQTCIRLLGYQPRGGQYPIVRWLYKRTQLRVHALVGRQYLRRLRGEWLAAHTRVLD
jgi:hypothetical protein